VAVADGPTALLTVGTVQPIAVIVTDVVMPQMSGIELAEQLMDAYPELGVVMLSGYTAETLDLERVTSRGAIFVPKPVASNQLLQAILRAAASRRAGVEPVAAA
jgi:CheY-like chemotaxis protein